MFASHKTRWWIVVAAMSGLMVGSGCINLFVFAVFLKPVSSDLGISRADFSFGLALAMLLGIVASPVVGGLNDRLGVRRVLLAGIPLYAATIAAFALVDDSLLSIYALFILAGLLGTTQNTVPYAKVVSTWFDRQRGLALGITLSGMGLGIATVPALTNLCIEFAGWRAAYVMLGITIVLFSLAPVWLFIDEARSGASDKSAKRQPSPIPSGLTWREAINTRRFWALCAAFFLAAVCINGTVINIVAMLTDRGVSSERAVMAYSAIGVAIIAGRLVCGWALDKYAGRVVAISLYVIASSGIVTLAVVEFEFGSIIGSFLCGLSLGGLIGLMAFFASRYFGLTAYGSIFGAFFGLFLFGSAFGTHVNVLLVQAMQTYTPSLMGFAIVLLMCSLLFVPLGPYPYGARPTPAAPTETPPAADLAAGELAPQGASGAVAIGPKL